MELQMLTSSCVKLQTVHHVPLSINKEGTDADLIHSSVWSVCEAVWSYVNYDLELWLNERFDPYFDR